MSYDSLRQLAKLSMLEQMNFICKKKDWNR